MSSRLSCWLHGHDWGPWDSQVWENIFGVGFRVRWCKQCGARDAKGA